MISEVQTTFGRYAQLPRPLVESALSKLMTNGEEMRALRDIELSVVMHPREEGRQMGLRSIAPTIAFLCSASLGTAASATTEMADPNADSFRTMDVAAVACLERAWSRMHWREMAGGVFELADAVGDRRYGCSDLVSGKSAEVTYGIKPHWVAHFHTHSRTSARLSLTRKGEKFSPADAQIVRREGPMHRPSYVRTPNGRFLKLERNSHGDLRTLEIDLC